MVVEEIDPLVLNQHRDKCYGLHFKDLYYHNRYGKFQFTLLTSTAYDFGKKGRLIPRIQDCSTQGKWNLMQGTRTSWQGKGIEFSVGSEKHLKVRSYLSVLLEKWRLILPLCGVHNL